MTAVGQREWAPCPQRTVKSHYLVHEGSGAVGAQQITWEPLHLMTSSADYTFATDGFSEAICKSKYSPTKMLMSDHFIINSVNLFVLCLRSSQGEGV